MSKVDVGEYLNPDQLNEFGVGGEETVPLECDCGARTTVSVPKNVEPVERRTMIDLYCQIETAVNDCCGGGFKCVANA